MSEITKTTRERIEAQGFVGFSDGKLAQMNYGLRFAPLVCMIWTAVGVVTASPIIIMALVPFAIAGGLTKGHPFDVIYNHGIARILDHHRLPDYKAPRRFTCLMASAMLITIAGGFYYGIPALGYGMGGFMILAIGVVVTTGFCIPSFVYGVVFGKPGGCELEA